MSLLSGKCDPDNLKVEEDRKQHPASPRLPEEDGDDPVTNIEAELLWENQPPPPRGDVPNRRQQDQAAHSHTHHRQLPGTGRTGRTGLAHGEVKVSPGLQINEPDVHVPVLII